MNARLRRADRIADLIMLAMWLAGVALLVVAWLLG